ncbi:MAG: hypothetical protein WC044_10050 [Crocinitomicaceae bacterium]
MKKTMIFFAVLLTAACSAKDPSDIDPTLKTNTETTKKIKEAQSENIELEAIDGELDSLIQTLK